MLCPDPIQLPAVEPLPQNLIYISDMKGKAL